MKILKVSKKILFISISLMISLSSCAQKKVKEKEGHKIVFDIAGLENQEILLAHHYNGKHYISDTIQLNEKGIGVIEGPENKEKGVYLAVMPSEGNRYFEFLISDQYFTVKTTKDSIAENLEFIASKENEIFTIDMKGMAEFKKQTDAMRKEVANAAENEKKAMEEKIKELNTEFIAKRDKLMEENPDLFYSDLLGLMKEVEIPEAPKKPNGELVDSSFGWNYWKKHYWDYTDFSEAGILRTPIYYKKLLNFVEKRTAPIQDSIISSCHFVIDKAKANDEVFKYTLVTLLNKYANSKIMGDDAIYVDLINNYYKTGMAVWTDSSQLAQMIERADALEPLLLDNISPDLILRDTTLKVKYRLHDVPFDYTIVFVWDPECGHCKKAVPVIKKFYDKYKNKSIMVYAISTINYQEIDEWKKFIVEKNMDFVNVADPYVETNFRKIYDISSTPQIYILDRNKKIIAKRIGADQLEEFFYNYFKNHDKAKFEGMENLTFEKVDSTKH